MDGTLTLPNLDFKDMYERCDVPLNEDILVTIGKMNPEKRAKAVSVIEEMEAEGARTLQLGPGVLEMAQWLQAHRIPMALVTRNTKNTVKVFHSNLWGNLLPFSPTITRDDPFPAKPNPDALYSISKEWGISLPSDELIMVGDSPSNDIEFGIAGGVKTVLVDTGRRYLEEKEGKAGSGGADICVESLALLPQLLWQRYVIGGEMGTAAPLKKYDAPQPGTPAALAASVGDIKALSTYSSEELNAIDLQSSNTPLIWAANGGHLPAVELLLSAKVEVDKRGFLGATACSRACRANHTSVLKALLQADADPNIANDKMQYPLHFAAFKKHPEVVKVLLGNDRVNTLVLDRKGRTPAEDTSDPDIRTVILTARQRQLNRALGF